MASVKYDPGTKTWTCRANGETMTTSSPRSAEAWLDMRDNLQPRKSLVRQVLGSFVLWCFYTVLLVGIIVVSPIVILYALLFDPD